MSSISVNTNSETMIQQFERKLFDVAMKLLKGEIKSTPMIKLTDSEKSPVVIPFDEIENSFIIFYPPNSDHYVDCWDGQRKLCRILDGTIYENTEKRVYSKNDEFTIEKGKAYDPYTRDSFCIAFVKKLD